ncbi:MAG: SdrD B-like domain-containing protein, partial [Dehalococcoidia bacterium]
MKTRILYTLMTLAMVLVLSITMTAPMAASRIDLKKDVTDAFVPNIYYVGQTIYYVMNVTNQETLLTSYLFKIWDTLPDGSEYWWLNEDEADPAADPLVLGPLETVAFNITYEVQEADIDWFPISPVVDPDNAPGYWAVINTFDVRGFDSLNDRADGTVQKHSRILRPNTEVSINASAEWVKSGASVNLTITETNTGHDPLTDVYVEVWKDTELLATLNSTHPSWSSSGNSDDILDPGNWAESGNLTETWTWIIDSGPITADTDIVVLGFGTDPLGNPVSFDAGYEDERDEVTVNVFAELGDFVWHDLNADGIQDDGEPGIAGVTVNLYACNGTPLDTTATNSTGYYLFDELMPGNYKVEFILPTDYVFSPQNQGTDQALDSNADPVTGFSECVTLVGGESNLTIDAGMYQYGTKSGCKFEDRNANGVWDAEEPALADWTINLWTEVAGNLTIVDTTTTNSTGCYQFTGLMPDVDYFVSEVIPEGWTQSYPNEGTTGALFLNEEVGFVWGPINLDSGEAEEDNDFGNYQYGTKSGCKFEDRNANG